jgi:hypothetical protein
MLVHCTIVTLFFTYQWSARPPPRHRYLTFALHTQVLSSFLCLIVDTYLGGTPADGSWTMEVTYRNNTGALAVGLETGTVTFLPSGKVGTTGGGLSPGFFDRVNNILAPTVTQLQLQANSTGVANFDFWEFMNWIFVSQYWLLLLDFGQISPSTFDYNSEGDRLDYGPVRHTAAYNIFVNDTLFSQYDSYLRQTILPLFNYTLADFLPINATNQMNERTVSLQMLYTCSDIRLKDSAGLIISVIVADWGMISSVVALGLFLLAAWRLRQVTDGAHTFRYINLIAVNHCEGCVKLRNGTIPISAPSSPSPTVERKDEILWARGK